MRKGWEYKKLGEVTSFFRGLTYSGKDEVDKSNNIVLRSNNIDLSTNSLNFDELKFISDSITIPQDKKLRKNSIFMCMSNGSKQHLGKVAFIEKEYPYAFGGFMGLIVPNEDKLVPKFTYYYFCSQKFKAYLSAIGNGANINNIKYIDIAKDSIPLPPLSTQLAIVTELDKINELIRLKKEQLKDFDNLAQSIFYEMFGDPVENEKGWEVKKLGDCFSYIKNGANIKQTKDVDGFPITRIETLAGGIFNRDRMGYAGIYDLSKYSAYVLESRDLLMSHINSKTYIGRTVEYKRNNDETIIHGMNLLRLKAIHDIIDSTFFVYYTKSGDFKSKIARIRKDAVNQSSFAISDLKRLNIPLPPLSLQRLFAQRIEQIEHQKAEVQKAIADLETLLASRMQYWFE